MFFGIVLMFVAKNFVRDCFVAQIRAKMLNVHARRNSRMSTRVARGSDATPSKILGYNIGTIPKNMSTKFQLKRSKLNLDIVEKPENREHKLTDSNVSPAMHIVDQRMGSKYSTKAKTNKWTNVVFYYLLDCSRVNSQTVWSLAMDKNPRETNSYDFGKALAKSLYLPAIQERSVQGLQPTVLQWPLGTGLSSEGGLTPRETQTYPNSCLP